MSVAPRAANDAIPLCNAVTVIFVGIFDRGFYERVIICKVAGIYTARRIGEQHKA